MELAENPSNAVGGDDGPRIDLTKSLHHLNRHGFDVSKMTQALSRRSYICQTPAVSPLKEGPTLRGSFMNGGPVFHSPVKPLTGIDRSASTESNSSYSSWEEQDDLDDVSYDNAELEDHQSVDGSYRSQVGVPSVSSRLMRSTINDNERDTVEVTLDRSCSYNEGAAYSEAYLEEYDYPPLTPQTPMRVTFCGLPHCFDGKSPFFLEDNGGLLRGNICQLSNGLCESLFQDGTTQETIQSEVCALLGVEGWCWQAVYPTTKRPFVQPISEFEETSDTSTGLKPRRTFNLAARRSRLDLIRRELHPFSDTPLVPDRYPLSKSQSFIPTSAPTFAEKRNEAQLNAMWECGSLDQAVFQERQSDGISGPDAGYDSDPEDYNKKANPTNALGMNAETVEEFLNERCTLVLHGEKSVAVHIWIERGQQLSDTIILPKLFWKPVHGHELSSLELIDICRILVLDHVDRSKYPFADSQRLMTVKSVSQKPLMFEARSVEERDRWVLLLKLTVSTLAAKFLTNDPSALSLFFVEQGLVPPERVHSQKPPPTQKLEAWV